MSADNNVIISVKDLKKYYNDGEVKALDGVTTDIKKGEVLTPDNIRSIRPGNGLPPIETDKVMGRHALRDLERGEPLKYEDFE